MDKEHKPYMYSSQIRVLNRISYLHVPPKLLGEIYYKSIILHLIYCIAVWSNCSVSMFIETDGLHVKAARIIHKIQQNVLERTKWQDLKYLCK